MCEPKLYRAIYRKAIKKHKCSGCGDDILKGHRYTEITGLWDDFQRYKHCQYCDKVTDLITADGAQEHFSIESPWEFLVAEKDYDETACDVADRFGLPVDYVSRFIK